ncbi:MAG TPA: DUF6268 family outer membrane beta-barrel protein [Puia sp.]|nr:DUF6268 family outer membrane beta-barrel protein [Puia sp.]
MRRSIFLAGILLPILSYSQSADSSIHSKLVTTSPALGGVTISDMVVPIKANGNTFTVQQSVVDVGIPIYKNFTAAHPVFIKTGIRYQGLFLSGEKNIGSNNFQSVTVPLLVSYSLSRSTNVTFIGSASVASDFRRNIEAEDIIYSAGVRIGFHQRSSFKFGVTMIYLSDYSGKYLLPVPDIDWTINKRWSLSAILPARVSVKYKISAAQSFGITAGLNNGQYSLNDQPKKQYLQLQQYSGGLIYDLKLGRNWKVNLIAGHSFSQRLETFNIDQKVSLNDFGKLNKRATNVSYRQNSFIFQGGISYQFR